MWHRKAHKTTLALNELIRWAYAVRGVYWYVAPFYSQAKKIVWHDPQMLPKYCPPNVWSRRNNSELYLPFPNGSILYILGADKPDSLRGPNPLGVVLDEYGDMRKEIWSGIIQPIMTANPKAWTWFMGTPKGRNDFFDKFQYAKTNDNWYSSLLKASQSGIISAESLAEAKKTTTEAFYKQEYECDFLDDASSVFRGVEDCVYDGDISISPDRYYHLGVDLGRHMDYTVLTPLDLHEYKLGIPDRFNQIDWPLQKAKIEALSRKLNNSRVKIDGTGIGDPIVSDLIAAGMNIQDEDIIRFTENSRRHLLDNLAIHIEQRKIGIPNYQPLIDELKAFRYILINPEGRRPRIGMYVPEGQHDDCVMSAALALSGANKLPIPKTKKISEFSQDNYYQNEPRFHY